MKQFYVELATQMAKVKEKEKSPSKHDKTPVGRMTNDFEQIKTMSPVGKVIKKDERHKSFVEKLQR